MAVQKKARKGFIVSIIGLLLVILGVLWLAVIFPWLDKVPTDYARSYYFDGSYQFFTQQGNVTIPIAQTLAQEATGTEGNALLIHEVRTVKNAITQESLGPQYNDESTLAVDRHTLEFVKEIDERQREGQWGPPRGLGEGDSFDLWNAGANKALEAKYVQEYEFRGMKVVLFRIDETNIPIGKNPQTQMDMYLSTIIDLTIDPKTGTVVEQDSVTTTSIDMMGQKIPVQISKVRYAEQTIVDLMDVAKDAQGMLMWFETVIPWLLIGIGGIMVVIDTLFLGRKQGK
ncbi:MAG: DUF3068 domain-containing protein [Chloroflexi bacterium]|nr:DUF3068 domain-containing protein [Chloroflexota bacterium]